MPCFGFLFVVRSQLKIYSLAHYFCIAHDPDSAIVRANAPCDMLASPTRARKQNCLLSKTKTLWLLPKCLCFTWAGPRGIDCYTISIPFGYFGSLRSKVTQKLFDSLRTSKIYHLKLRFIPLIFAGPRGIEHYMFSTGCQYFYSFVTKY